MKVAAQLPLVGWKKAGYVAKRFKSVQAMMEASEKEWREVEGIGKVLAKRIYEGLRGER
jgi:ERCC4-type nuclease